MATCHQTELYQFLHARRADGRPTHTSLSPKGKYMITGGDMEQFWRLYNYFYAIEPLCITETQTSSHIPVLVDIDLKLETDSDSVTLYTERHVEVMVGIYQKILMEVLQDGPENMTTCFLMEKAPYRVVKNGREYLKNGYHLHFPFIFMNRYYQEHILTPRVRMELKKLHPGDYPACTTADKMVDSSYCRGSGSPWLLYGSRKDTTMEPYLATRAYLPNGSPVEDWWRLLAGMPCCGLTLDDKEGVEGHLPEIFSIHVEGHTDYVRELKPGIQAVNWDKPPVGMSLNKPKPAPKLATPEEDQENDVVPKLVDLLSMERCSDYNEWMRIGWVLWNIYDGGAKGYENWVAFSRRCPDKFDESVCSYEWSRMEKRDMTLGTLKYMARQDNPDGYDETMRQSVQPYMDRCLKLDGAHHDLAMVLYMKYGLEYRCASIVQKVWYQFRGHVWNRIEEGYTLRQKISSDIVQEYEKMAKRYTQNQFETACEDKVESESMKKRASATWKMVNRLKTSPYKTNVMKEAMEVFYDESFMKKLDMDPYLIAFSNGVYDLKNFEFRDGTPNDCISLKMTIPYRPELTMESPEVVQVLEYFEKVFPDHELREYFLNTSADVFVGGNFNKIVQVWSGEGDNAKSITESLFEKMLGPYAIKLPTALIIGKRTQSSSASPELVRAGNGVRLAMLQEPDKRDVINIGILKELSGNDTFFARGLYKEGSEITPMFKLALICNELPNLHDSDKATWNRIRVIPFEAKFKDDAPASHEEQLRTKVFPRDPQFKDKIPSMLEGMAWYLIQRLRTKPKVIHEPEKVTRATEHYKRKNDVWRLFAEEYIEKGDDKSVRLSDMYIMFKDWFKESFPNSSLPSKIDMREYFTRDWGEPQTAHVVWTGRGMRSYVEE